MRNFKISIILFIVINLFSGCGANTGINTENTDASLSASQLSILLEVALPIFSTVTLADHKIQNIDEEDIAYSLARSLQRSLSATKFKTDSISECNPDGQAVLKGSGTLDENQTKNLQAFQVHFDGCFYHVSFQDLIQNFSCDMSMVFDGTLDYATRLDADYTPQNQKVTTTITTKGLNIENLGRTHKAVFNIVFSDYDANSGEFLSIQGNVNFDGRNYAAKDLFDLIENIPPTFEGICQKLGYDQ